MKLILVNHHLRHGLKAICYFSVAVPKEFERFLGEKEVVFFQIANLFCAL